MIRLSSVSVFPLFDVRIVPLSVYFLCVRFLSFILSPFVFFNFNSTLNYVSLFVPFVPAHIFIRHIHVTFFYYYD
jgi:hypothetical protein